MAAVCVNASTADVSPSDRRAVNSRTWLTTLLNAISFDASRENSTTGGRRLRLMTSSKCLGDHSVMFSDNFAPSSCTNNSIIFLCVFFVISLEMTYTRSPATAGKANRSLLFLEHRIPMPELFTELRFSVLREFWTQVIRLPLLGGDAPRLGW